MAEITGHGFPKLQSAPPSKEQPQFFPGREDANCHAQQELTMEHSLQDKRNEMLDCKFVIPHTIGYKHFATGG